MKYVARRPRTVAPAGSTILRRVVLSAAIRKIHLLNSNFLLLTNVAYILEKFLAVCCNLLLWNVHRRNVMQCDAVCCSVLRCVAVCCSVFQCVCTWTSCTSSRYVATRMIKRCLCDTAVATASWASVDLDGFLERTASGDWFGLDSSGAGGKRQPARCSRKTQDKFAIASMVKKFLHRCMGAHARVHVQFTPWLIHRHTHTQPANFWLSWLFTIKLLDFQKIKETTTARTVRGQS